MSRIKMKLKRGDKTFLIRVSKSGRPHLQKVCIHCEVDFLATKSTAKYCSDSCKTMFLRKKQKEAQTFIKIKKIKRTFRYRK